MEPAQYIPSDELQQRFNASPYPSMIQEGILRTEIVRTSHLKNPAERDEPTCTHSQFVRYSDHNGQWLVEVHRYLRPDGTLGASGMPDPKRLRIGDEIFLLDRDSP